MAGGDASIGMACVSAGVLTKHLAFKELNRSFCGRCRGTGFDRFTTERASRQCPRCRGEGSTRVGSTKR